MTFKQWEKIAFSKSTRKIGHNIIRDRYDFPNGIEVVDDFVTPWNVFQKSFSVVTVVYVLPLSTHIPGGEMRDDGYYGEEGYGFPVFLGDNAMEKAYNFAMKLI